MPKIAVIKTGGKQYKVKEKDIIKIEKIPGKAGDKVEFDQVLMIADGDNVEIGKPILEGKKVAGKILEQGRAKKVLVVKYKPKTRYKKRVGHRQSFTKIEVTQI
ncbi:50S ribosomal protein L21 [Candidatus Falkowbacteria bacterium]|nr:50S ribosomal protein L21 [Candidatus Falkowbacteria bacterium]